MSFIIDNTAFATIQQHIHADRLQVQNGGRYHGYDLDKFDAATRVLLNFTTKEEYVNWVRAWKSEYKNLSEQIRQCKRDRKGPPSVKKEDAMWYAPKLGEQATAMLHLRAVGKVKAERIWADTTEK